MANANEYGAVIGIVQHFPNKALIEEREVGGQIVREFTVKSVTSGKLVRVTLWPEWPEVAIEKGSTVSADGKIKVDDGRNGMKFYGITPYTLCITAPIQKLEREDQPERAESTDDNDADGPLF